MPTYIALINYTEKGIQEFEGLPERLEAAREKVEKIGGEFKDYYVTLGEYDAIAVIEFPDAKSAAVSSVKADKQGYIRVETLRAFDEGELEEIIEHL